MLCLSCKDCCKIVSSHSNTVDMKCLFLFSHVLCLSCKIVAGVFQNDCNFVTRLLFLSLVKVIMAVLTEIQYICSIYWVARLLQDCFKIFAILLQDSIHTVLDGQVGFDKLLFIQQSCNNLTYCHKIGAGLLNQVSFTK